MSNLYGLFKDLIPTDQVLVGTITSSSGDTHQVTCIDGSIVVVVGVATMNQKVFIKGGTIQGTAPDLTLETIEI